MEGPGVVVVVEIPKASRNEYEIDHDTGELFPDRMLFTSRLEDAATGR